jgi:hypothetical protein
VTPFASQPDDFAVFDSAPGSFVFAAWKNVLIAVWAGQIDGASVGRFTKAVDEMSARRPGLRSNVHVVMQGTALPTTEARAGLVGSMTRHSGELASVAVVFCGTGFWASALRAAVTGMRFLAPRSFDFQLFGAIDEVIQWLPPEHEKITGVYLDPAGLRSALRAAQGRLSSQGKSAPR